MANGANNSSSPGLLTRRGRRKKFTPECIQQIKNLVERGKTREEIAELLDVTVGSLQVTCSKLGIRLRVVSFKSRPTASRRAMGYANKKGPNGSVLLQPTTEQHQQGSQLVGQARTTKRQRTQTEAAEAITANLSIRIQYKGEERTTELPLTELMISRLALEAEFRDIRICELVGQLLTALMTKKDLFQLVLDPPKNPNGLFCR